MGVDRTLSSIQTTMRRWRVLESRSRTTFASAHVVQGEGGYGGCPDSFLDTDNHAALAGVRESLTDNVRWRSRCPGRGSLWGLNGLFPRNRQPCRSEAQ